MQRAMIMAAWLTVLLISSATPATTLAPISQLRSVSSCAGLGSESDPLPTSCATLPASDRDASSSAATDFADFDALVSSSFGVVGNGASSSATQQSQIAATSIVATGSTTSSGILGGVASATSNLAMTLQIPVATSYTLTGELAGNWDASASVQLVGPSGTLVGVFSSWQGEPSLFAYSGVLEAGQYTLSASSFACSSELTNYCGQGYGSSYFDFAFVIPEPSTAILVGSGLVVFAGLRRRPRA
jgi:hypothetical protein